MWEGSEVSVPQTSKYPYLKSLVPDVMGGGLGEGSYGGRGERSHFLLCLPWPWLVLVLLVSWQTLSSVFVFGF